MKYISFTNILIQIQLFALSGERFTYAFQLTREKAIRSYSTELFLSYQSIAASLPKETNKESQLLDRPRLRKTIPSGQNQLPLHIRIAKGIYEESLPWVVSFILPLLASFVLQSNIPLWSHLFAETSFLIYCTHKMLNKLNVPTDIESPLRQWEDVANLVWQSQDNIDDRREFLMGWFYDTPFEKLRMEDAISYLAWMRYGLPLEYGVLTEEEISSLCEFDLPLLLDHVNDGKELPARTENESPLPFIRFNCEPLRYRHKSLLFYGVTHGANYIFQRMLKKAGFEFVPAKNADTDLSYWYRLPFVHDQNFLEKQEAKPLVFIHGVGGLGFCNGLVQDLKDATASDNVPIVLIDLPHVSLRMYDEIPHIKAQTKAISQILDGINEKVGNFSHGKATLVGHSYGTVVMSWLVQSEPDRIGGCVFLDPICFQLHLKTTLFNFHLQRVDQNVQKGKPWSNPFALESLVNLAGTEMHTNYAMLRKFSWASNALWPTDLVSKGIPSKVLLSGSDEIVPVRDVERLFQDFSDHVETYTFENASHGDMFVDESMRSLALEKIISVMNLSRQIENTETALGTKHELTDPVTV